MFKLFCVLLASLSEAVASERPNVLLICIDDLRPELKSFGVDYIHSPMIDSLAVEGRVFPRHYVQAPICGASRYALLTGRYADGKAPRSNDALFKVDWESAERPVSMPEHFRENGYETVSIGKVSHHPGGLGGKDWNDESAPEVPGAWDFKTMPAGEWKNPRRAMHGYTGGKGRKKGSSPASEHEAGDDKIYTDGIIAAEAVSQIERLGKGEKPFFLAVGLMKPHLPFACPEKYRKLYDGVKLPPIKNLKKPKGLSTWHGSGEFFGNYVHQGRDPRTDPKYADELRRSYAACVSYADAQVGKLLEQIEASGLSDNTIIVLWGDHGWHLGEHNIWGKHSLYEESLRSPLIIKIPGMKNPGKHSAAIVETIDIYPTLCELSGLKNPKGLDGETLRPQIDDPSKSSGVAVACSKKEETLRNESYRLIRHRIDGKNKFELYDLKSDPGETKNVAAKFPKIVAELNAELSIKIQD